MITTFRHLGQSGLPLATWSPCKHYRYTLRRVWRSVDEPRVVTWVLLNPGVHAAALELLGLLALAHAAGLHRGGGLTLVASAPTPG